VTKLWLTKRFGQKASNKKTFSGEKKYLWRLENFQISGKKIYVKFLQKN